MSSRMPGVQTKRTSICLQSTLSGACAGLRAARGGDLPTFARMNGEVQSGLEGVVAFATEIAEPDKDGGALRYRGVDIEEIVGQVPFERVWGLLVDGTFEPGLPPAEPHPLAVRSGDPRADAQAALALLGPEWGFQALIDISDEQARDDLARASVMALSFVAQSARGAGVPPVPQREVDKAGSIPERFLIRWRGEADPDHAKAIDAYWISAAEHGMNASTFTARVVTSTGADVAAALSAAVGALSGPLHGARAGIGARGGGGSTGAGGSGGAPRAQARPRAGDERRVLVGGGFGLRRGPTGPVHALVHLRAHRRLERPHPRAEARGAPDPADVQVRGCGAAGAGRGVAGGWLRCQQTGLMDPEVDSHRSGVGGGPARALRTPAPPGAQPLSPPRCPQRKARARQ